MNESSYGPVRDRGMSIVELVVAISIALLVVAGVVMVLINMWRAQSDVDTTTFSTARAQQIGSQIERAVRNAEALQVSDDGNTLRVRTEVPGAPACQGWSVQGGELRTTSRAGTLADPGSWAVWMSNVASSPSGPHFAGDLDGLAYAFRFATTGAPVDVAGESYARTASKVSAPCW